LVLGGTVEERADMKAVGAGMYAPQIVRLAHALQDAARSLQQEWCKDPGWCWAVLFKSVQT
jgi:hypothetical protein